MSNTKFVEPWSPAPWKYDGSCRVDSLPLRKESTHGVTIDKDGDAKPYYEGMVALVYSAGNGEGEQEANARLIELAPKMASLILDMHAETGPHSELCGCAVCDFFRRANRLAEKLIPSIVAVVL